MMENLGVVVTVFIFAITQLILFFKWITKLSEEIKVLATRFEERTSLLREDVKKINNVLETLATAALRVNQVERQALDHEERIREIERKCREFGQS